MDIEKIKLDLASDIEKFIEIRRYIHKNPELSMKEYNTTDYIYNKLKSFCIEDVKKIGETGVVAVIYGKGEKTIAIRADIDALPLNEDNNLEFRSSNLDAMHACGHDIHTTSLIGAAYYFNKYKDELSGNIKLIFQPGEEIGKGAKYIIESGVLEEDPVPECIFALHSWPHEEAGIIFHRHKKMGASSDTFNIKIIGKSGHAAHPEKCVDPVFILGNLILAIQGIISRELDPLSNGVITIASVHGGDRANKIPEEIELKGSIRALDEDTRKFLHKRLREVTENICKTFNGESEIDIKNGVPVSYNDERVSKIIEDSITEYIGNEFYKENPDPTMGSEDFAYYKDLLPGAMYRLGVGFKDRENFPLHSNKFIANEEAIFNGILSMVVVADSLIEKY